MDHSITNNFFAKVLPIKQKGACTSSKVPIIHFSVHTRVKTCIFKKNKFMVIIQTIFYLFLGQAGCQKTFQIF